MNDTTAKLYSHVNPDQNGKYMSFYNYTLHNMYSIYKYTYIIHIIFNMEDIFLKLLYSKLA